MKIGSRVAGPVGAAVSVIFLALAAGQGRAADSDPDFEAVKIVCGRCHSPALFQNKPRSWERWNDVFADMTQRGANGTDEQLMRVTRYFLENLTLLNVNSSPAEELEGVLGITGEAAQCIIRRREQRAFTSLADLRTVPGVDADKLEQRKSRIFF